MEGIIRIFSVMKPRFLILSLILAAFAAEAVEPNIPVSTTSGTWYERKAEGWHWYQDPQKEEEAKPEEPPPPPAPAPMAEVKPEPPKPVEPPPPAPFSGEWLKVNLPKYRMIAIDNPTHENVEAYYILQRLAMDKAERFARVSREVQIGNRLLDENASRPIASFGRTLVAQEAKAGEEAVFKKLRDKVGLFYFFKSDCIYCKQETPIIESLEFQGFQVIAIAVDGIIPPDTKLRKVLPDGGHAERLGVSVTPTLIAVEPKEQVFAVLGEGLLSLSEAKARFLEVAHIKKWITDEEYSATQKMVNPDADVDLSKELPLLLAQAGTSNPEAAALASSPGMSEALAVAARAESAANLMNLTKEQTDTLFVGKDGMIDPSVVVSLAKRADKRPLPNPDVPVSLNFQ